jgi:protein-S-isoprenylcysteine O-methyltransferase Ste14
VFAAFSREERREMAAVASVVGLLLMVGGLGTVILRKEVVSTEPLTVVLQVGAVALMVWARLSFGRRSFHATASPTPGGLVTSGPYGWIRHPIYTAVSLFAWACVLGHPSLVAMSAAMLVTVGGLMRMRAEESALRLQYPEYLEYARQTKRMLPYVF